MSCLPAPLSLRCLPRAVLAACLMTLTGCDQLGIEPASLVAARKEAEGKAIGGGCRHAERSIEQCYAQNKRADKAAVFAGWREMNDYMRENKIASAPADVEVARAEPAAGSDASTEAAAKPNPAQATAARPPVGKKKDS